MDKMLDTLCTGLKEISHREENIFIRHERSVKLCINTLTDLKALVTGEGFKTKQDEIRFFKTVKPRFESLLKFHAALFDLEKHRPHGGVEVQRRYLEDKLNEINRLVKSDIEFYIYHKTGSKHLDEVYFTRCSCPFQLALQHAVFDIDLNFRSSHDHKIARILAYEMLAGYLGKQISQLGNGPANNPAPHLAAGKFTWQAPKAALVELIYALNAQAVFGSSNHDIKELVAFFETMFNIQLGDCYGIFRDIKDRKSGRTKFIDCIKESLIRQLDLEDEIIHSQK